jgi:GxxExxY protein
LVEDRPVNPEHLEADLTGRIIGAAIAVHRALGPGLLESAYQACLERELEAQAIPFQRQLSLPVRYRDLTLEVGYRIDLLVADAVVVELKAVDSIEMVHESQLLTYLRMSGKRVGLLINFNVPKLRDGVVRRVL